MAKIWTMGEILVEIMRPKAGIPFEKTDQFLGPFPSGAPAIFIDTVARLGHEAGIVGGVGNDGFGRNVLNRLKNDGVNCDYVKVIDGEFTAVAFVSYSEEGSRDFIYHVAKTPATVLHDISNINIEADCFHIMGCTLMFNKDFADNVIQLAKKLYTNGSRISFDPNIRKELLKGSGIQDIMEEIMRMTSIFLPGIDEIKLIANKENETEAVERIFSKYSNIEFIVLKRGKKGATIFTRDEKIDIQAYKIKEIDPTGAGDCFDAAFICGILEGRTPLEAGKMAAIAGAINAAAFGPMEGKISRKKIEQLLNQF